MAFKDLFKKKEGGTFVGNLIRGAANKATGGMLGNGVMLSKNATEAIATGVGAGVAAANATADKPKVDTSKMKWKEALALGYAKQYILQRWYYIAIPVVILGIVVWYFIKKAKNKKKGYKR